MNFYIQQPIKLKPKAKTLCNSNFTIVNSEQEAVTALIGVHQVVDLEFLANFPRLKYLLCPATGLNHIHQDALSIRGIKLYSLRDCMQSIKSTTSTTELTIMMMLLLMRGGSQLLSALNQHKHFNRLDFEGYELSKYSVGIIGCGRIGGGVYKILKSFGTSVKVWDIDEAKLKKISKHDQADSLPSLLCESQVISLHANLTLQNSNLIDKKAFSQMQDSTYLINTARAELVDRESLLKAIESNRIKGYAADVHWDEKGSVSFDNKLVQLRDSGKNIYLTPHIGGCTHEAIEHTQFTLISYFLNHLQN